MPQVVEPYRPKLGALDQLTEPLGDEVGIERSTVLASEDQPVIGIRSTPLLTLRVLDEPLRQQHTDAPIAEVNPPRLTARRLRRAERDAVMTAAASRTARRLTIQLDDLLTHHEHLSIDVHVLPSEAARLASSQGRESHQLVEGPKPWADGVRRLYVRISWREITGRVVGGTWRAVPRPLPDSWVR